MKPTKEQCAEALRLYKQSPRRAANWITACEDADEASQRGFAVADAVADAVGGKARPISAALSIVKSWVGHNNDPEHKLLRRLLNEAKKRYEP